MGGGDLPVSAGRSGASYSSYRVQMETMFILSTKGTRRGHVSQPSVVSHGTHLKIPVTGVTISPELLV